MQNPFDNPGFAMASLTAAINILPNRYGRLEQLNLFPAKPVRTRQIIVEEYAGKLNLLPTRPVGSPGTVGERGTRKLRSFVIPHIRTTMSCCPRKSRASVPSVPKPRWTPSRA